MGNEIRTRFLFGRGKDGIHMTLLMLKNKFRASVLVLRGCLLLIIKLNTCEHMLIKKSIMCEKCVSMLYCISVDV